MPMNIKNIALAISLMAMASCTDEDIVDSNISSPDFSDMRITAEIAPRVKTRSAIGITEWNDRNTKAGLAVTLYSGTTKNSGLYPNGKGTVKYTTTNGVWNAETVVPLYSKNAYPTAYFPMSIFGDNADPTALRIATLTDLLYCPLGTCTVNMSAPDGHLIMYHAFSYLQLRVRNNGYTGTGKVSSIRINSEAIGTEGIFDSTTGEFSDVKNPNGCSVSMYAENSISGGIEVSQGFYVIPNSSEAKDILFRIEVDGQMYTYTVKGCFEQGKIHEYQLSLSDKGIELSDVTITPWESTDTLYGTLTLQ